MGNIMLNNILCITLPIGANEKIDKPQNQVKIEYSMNS